MSMHLVGPYLTTTGKKKGKRKFRNAASAAKARENANEWNDLLKRHNIQQEAKRQKRAMSSPVYNPPVLKYRGSDEPKIPSRNSTSMDPCTKPSPKVYTGDKVKGIGVMHKSNAVPIFSDQEAKDIAHMRR